MKVPGARPGVERVRETEPVGRASTDRPSGEVPAGPAPEARNHVRRTVAGAAGGMKGVDYEDDAPTAGPPIGPLPASPPIVGRETAPARLAIPSASLPIALGPAAWTSLPRDDDDPLLREAQARSRAHRFVPRDRLTVDKDAPHRRRRVRWDLLEPDAEEPRFDPETVDVDLDAIAEAIAAAGDAEQPRAHLFASAEEPARPWDPGLVDPDEARERLGTPLAYARHALLLSEVFRRTTGATRAETVAYLAALFVALSDRGFGRRALRALGPGTGIVDVYPLEVVAYILEHHPGFLRKVTWGSFLVDLDPPGGSRARAEGRGAHSEPLELEPFRARVLHLPADWRVRGFAVVGGARPGYRLEPDAEPGRYRLVLGAVGDFTLLVSALTPRGATVIQRLDARVRGDGPPAREPAEPARDAEKVAAWPWPAMPDEATQPDVPAAPTDGSFGAALLDQGSDDPLPNASGQT